MVDRLHDIWDHINEAQGTFGSTTNFIFDDITATHVAGHAELGPDHHQPWGIVHGGVYATIVESVASVGASYAVKDQNMFAVGLHNGTDFLRQFSAGTVLVEANALYQGRTQQLWDVVITAEATGKVLARGQLRLQNLPAPENQG
ncbi:PaaI family thioesterase [Auritidibacter ignavus]|uniref:PaaI family thioesterase n=1 Tax=Auritidibacter ignavus TaxID=678932 RepID=UPI00244A49BF|nr:PaaI family thioesterase [Auritidibacter ignavus]WGH83279.1 PaaI family thioesterase [Auritidibacter ignavus]WHS29048.1 PaaI family thioesterase [Auritidibacter ignavus]